MRLKLKICPLLILGPHSKVNDRLILTILRFQYSSWSKGDILVRNAEGCGQSCGDTPLANPDLLWPSGIVEFRFYKTFPKKHAIEMKKAMRYITNRTSCVTFEPATS